MEIVHAEKEHFKLLQEFITPFESTCVQLASCIRKESPKVYFLQRDNLLLGVLFVDSSLLHCIPSPQNLTPGETKLLQDFLTSGPDKPKIKSIAGETTTSEFLIHLLEENLGVPFQTNSYTLMTAETPLLSPEPLVNDDIIIRCTENDIETLTELQKQYLIEEVAPKGKKVSEAEVSMELRQILKNQVCLALFSDGEPVAKANTNAIGFGWVQLGGVYTSPLYRRNGYAWHLVHSLCTKAFSAGKKIALFVKNSNFPALELYKKIGFSTKSLYTIAYY